MQNHYHPTLLRSGPNAVPRILGLTASPVVRSTQNELESVHLLHDDNHFQQLTMFPLERSNPT